MINIPNLLFEICENEHVFEPDFDLIESALLDSYAFIQLFSRLEENGIIIQPTRIDRESLRTPRKIEKLVSNYLDNKGV